MIAKLNTKPHATKIFTAEGGVGIIVGRFQVSTLHAGHTKLIETVCKMHNETVVFIGTNSILGSKKDPLTFANRKHLFDTYNISNIIPLPDMPTKKSKAGRMTLIKTSGGEFKTVSLEESLCLLKDGATEVLQEVYKNGFLRKEYTLAECRENAKL